MSSVGYIIGIENVVHLYLNKVLKQYGRRLSKISPDHNPEHKRRRRHVHLPHHVRHED